MKINYLGHSCFKIEFSDKTSVVCDPFTKIGYEMKDVVADILTCSHQHYDHNCIKKVKSSRLIVNSGDYSFLLDDKVLKITGIDSWHDEKRGSLRGNNVMYKFEYDGVTLCHMGDIGEEVSDDLVKKIGKVDILLIPVGGTYTVDAKGATAWGEKILPKIVIPMHYKQKTCNIDIVGVENFLKLNSDKKITHVDGQIEIYKTTLTQDKIEIIEMGGENND